MFLPLYVTNPPTISYLVEPRSFDLFARKFSPLLDAGGGGGEDEIQWCFSQVKGTIEDEVADGKYLEPLYSSPWFFNPTLFFSPLPSFPLLY